MGRAVPAAGPPVAPRLGDGAVDFFRAAGWGGQDIFVYPALDMVVVFTRGGFYDDLPLNDPDDTYRPPTSARR